MSNILPFPKSCHSAAASVMAKSAAVTRLPVTVWKATASSLESQTLPRLNREIVERLQAVPVARIRVAMPSSSKPSLSMNSDSCMDGNVHGVHNKVNPGCASGGMEAGEIGVHLMHMANPKRKTKVKEEPRLWAPTYLRQWREHKGLSLEEASAEMGLKYSQLSRIERGIQQYNQNVVEVAARLYSTSVWSILNCPPGLPPDEVFAAFTRSLKVG